MDFLFFYYLAGYASSVAASFYFSGSEAGFLSLNREKYAADLQDRNPDAKRIEPFFHNPEDLLSTTLFGNNLANIVATQLGIGLCLFLFVDPSPPWILVFNGMTVFFLFTFGEVIPKILFKTYARPLIYKTSRLLFIFKFLFLPIVVFIRRLSDWIVAPFSGNGNGSMITISRKDFTNILYDSYQEGLMDQEEIRLFHTASSLSQTKAVEVMKPLADLYMINKYQDIDAVLDQIKKSGDEILPVYDGRIDHLVGHIDIMDIFNSTKRKRTVKDFLIPAEYVPETNTLDEIYRQFAQTQNRTLIVVDEYGGCSGMIVETEIIKRIFRFEHHSSNERRQKMIKQVAPRHYEVDTLFDIDDLNERLGLALPKKGYETLGGFINYHHHTIPRPGEVIEFLRMTIRILEADETGVDKVSIILHKDSEDEKKKNKIFKAKQTL